jgi:hypothetical protein
MKSEVSMLKILRLLLWVTCAMGFGVLLSTVRVGDQTPVQRAQRLWKKYGMQAKLENRVTDLKDSVQGTFDNVKDRVTGDAKRKPSEHHSAQDREAIDKLIARSNRSE